MKLYIVYAAYSQTSYDEGMELVNTTHSAPRANLSYDGLYPSIVNREISMRMLIEVETIPSTGQTSSTIIKSDFRKLLPVLEINKVEKKAAVKARISKETIYGGPLLAAVNFLNANPAPQPAQQEIVYGPPADAGDQW